MGEGADTLEDVLRFLDFARAGARFDALEQFSQLARADRGGRAPERMGSLRHVGTRPGSRRRGERSQPVGCLPDVGVDDRVQGLLGTGLAQRRAKSLEIY